MLVTLVVGLMNSVSAILNGLVRRQHGLRHYLANGKGILGCLDGQKRGNDWMKEIGDETLLSAMTIPGTHDAAAYNYTGDLHEFWNCQTQPLFAQLDSGIRALDLRYALLDGKLHFFHSIALLDKKAEVIDIVYGLHAWLQKHPSETIVVSLKVDNGDPAGEEVQRLMGEVLDVTKAFWVENVTTATTLKEARGKLVLMRRFPFSRPVGFDVALDWKVNDGNFKMPLDTEGKTFAQIEDFYLLQHLAHDAEKQVEKKWDVTKAHLLRAQKAIETDPKDLWITFSSAVGDRKLDETEDVTPRVMALGRGSVHGVNQHMKDWCAANRPKAVGIVFMDFVTVKRKTGQGEQEELDPDLIRAFIEMNPGRTTSIP
ncbi:SubName: Full=Uncharacterized protein {ECO:0000313/EMBL:CCA77974.1} [Serendipita indica DSM 11827]|nr:SubName: Full=Uncharacterized protein {ECO:0000313/EMBL:CCA77974.1} [Serendipita indica DSM 11827]